MDAFVIFLAPLVPVTVIGSVVGVAMWVLRPVDVAARNRRHPAQFTMADFLCLFFLIQLWMTPIHAWVPAEQPWMTWLFDAFAWFSSGLLWWFGVQSLSRAGVRNTWHRSIFLAVVLPVSLSGAMVLPLVAFAICRMMFQRERVLVIVLWVGIEVALMCGVYACGLFTRRIVARASPPAQTVERAQ